MNMFLHELRSYRKSTLIWTCSLVALVVFLLSMFPTYSANAEDMKKLLEGFPEEVRRAMGFSLDNIATLNGYYSVVFTYVMLCGSIQAMNLGLSIISKETTGKTADFLLTKPVSRFEIMTSKLLAALACLGFTNCIYLIGAGFMASMVKSDPFSFKAYFMISLTLPIVQLVFMSLGLVVSVLASRIKSVISVSLGTVFAFFIASMLSSAAGDNKLRYATPFRYFDPSYIMKNSAYESSYVIVALVIIIVCVSTSFLVYSRKDTVSA